MLGAHHLVAGGRIVLEHHVALAGPGDGGSAEVRLDEVPDDGRLGLEVGEELAAELDLRAPLPADFRAMIAALRKALGKERA